MSIDQRIDELIRLLTKGTEDKSLRWEATSDENAFRLSSPTANVRLTMSEEVDEKARDSSFTRRLHILNDKGRVIEEFIPSTVPEKKSFDDLFTAAKRSAYKTDEVLEKLMSELQKKVRPSA